MKQLDEIAAVLDAPAPAAPSATAAPSAAMPPAAGKATPAAADGLWSKRRVERAKARDLRRYVLELQDRVPAAAAGEMAPPVPPQTGEERLRILEQALAPSFTVAAGMASRLLGAAALDLSAAEARTLAQAWAPIALPHYDDLIAGLPWAVAIGTTWEIGAPKIAAMMRQRAAAKLEAAEPAAVIPPTPPGSNAPPGE